MKKNESYTYVDKWTKIDRYIHEYIKLNILAL